MFGGEAHAVGIGIEQEPGIGAHVRVSQTEPIVRVICEQKGGSPTELFESLMELVRTYAA